MNSHLSDNPILNKTDTESFSIDSEDELFRSARSDSFPVNTSMQEQPLVVDSRHHDNTMLNVPDDPYNFIYIIILIQGIGMLLPWNFFITAKSYFDYKLVNDKLLQDRFESAFSLSAMVPNVISLYLNIFLTGRMPRGIRIIVSLIIMFLTFVITTILVEVDSQSWPVNFFAVTVFLVVLINLAAGIFQGTLFGIVGLMGSRYTQSAMCGQALAGIFAAVADLISKLTDSSGKNPTTSAFIYFTIASVVILITLLSYFVLRRLPQMQLYFKHEDRHESNKGENEELIAKEKNSTRVPYLLIFKNIMPLALSVSFVFCVTLAMFPAVISKIESVNKSSGSRWTNDLFPTLVCFLVFNCGDWCGRIIAGYFQIVSAKGIYLPLLCISRIIFIPAFLFCNRPNSIMPYLFKHDAYPIVLNLLFSLSNGYLGSLCMMYGPTMVKKEYAETAGTIMSLFLTLGLSLGSCISFAL